MLSTLRRAAAIVAIAASTGCEHIERTTVLPSDPHLSQKYGYVSVEDHAGRALTDHLIGASLSGGGTRAAALAHGALLALRETNIVSPSGESGRLIDEVDLVSAVSGGAVTATYWALHGPDALQSFPDTFLYQNVQDDQIIKKLFNPATLVHMLTPYYARGDLLRDYFDKDLFGQATYGHLLAIPPAPGSAGNSRPYLVLNSLDMDSGHTFSFTQEWFHLLCADLRSVKLADAVAASAAYPGALTAVPLKNHILSTDCPIDTSQTLRQRVDLLTSWIADAIKLTNEAKDKAASALRQAKADLANAENRLGDVEKLVTKRNSEVQEATSRKTDASTAKEQATSQVANSKRKLKETQTAEEIANQRNIDAKDDEDQKRNTNTEANLDLAAHKDTLSNLSKKREKMEGERDALNEDEPAAPKEIEGTEKQVAGLKEDEPTATGESEGTGEQISAMDEDETDATRESQKTEEKAAALDTDRSTAANEQSTIRRRNYRQHGKLTREINSIAEKMEEATKKVLEAQEKADDSEKELRTAEGIAATRESEFKKTTNDREDAETKLERAQAEEIESRTALEVATRDLAKSTKQHEDAVKMKEEATSEERRTREVVQHKSRAHAALVKESQTLENLRDLDALVKEAREDVGMYDVNYTEKTRATIHLLDGGISDNLGLTPFVELLAPVLSAKGDVQARERIDHLVTDLTVVVVNAGAKSTTEYGANPSPPGLIDTLKTAVGASIDSKSFLLRSKLDGLRDAFGKLGISMALIYVGFDAIGKLGENEGSPRTAEEYQDCEDYYNRIPTNWKLSKNVVDNLIAMGGALLRHSPEFRDLLHRHGSAIPSGKSVEEVCESALRGEG